MHIQTNVLFFFWVKVPPLSGITIKNENSTSDSSSIRTLKVSNGVHQQTQQQYSTSNNSNSDNDIYSGCSRTLPISWQPSAEHRNLNSLIQV